MTVLVVGSGAREHALVRGIVADPAVAAVHVAPGNPGTAAIATNHDVAADDVDALVALAQQLSADLVVVGPEAPLVAGLADRLREAGVATFGPGKEAARLEGSKAFAKEVMAAAGVPTAAARTCTTPEEIDAALAEFGAPYVVKDDGLAGGKGVVVTSDLAEAKAHAASCARVVIEEYLDGPEVSLFAVCDGERGLPMLPAQDFKRVGEGDTGPNTGGMGAYVPLPWVGETLVADVMASVVDPVLAELRGRGTPFTGLLYTGLAITAAGPKVVEFNVRFGDPETQPLLSLLETPLAQLLHAAATGRLDEVPELSFAPGYAVGVVLAANGYPAKPVTGEELTVPEGDAYLHAGTRRDGDRLVSAGGRVLTVLGHAGTLAGAREAAYDHVDRVDFPGGFCRRDIAGR